MAAFLALCIAFAIFSLFSSSFYSSVFSGSASCSSTLLSSSAFGSSTGAMDLRQFDFIWPTYGTEKLAISQPNQRHVYPPSCFYSLIQMKSTSNWISERPTSMDFESVLHSLRITCLPFYDLSLSSMINSSLERAYRTSVSLLQPLAGILQNTSSGCWINVPYNSILSAVSKSNSFYSSASCSSQAFFLSMIFLDSETSSSQIKGFLPSALSEPVFRSKLGSSSSLASLLNLIPFDRSG